MIYGVLNLSLWPKVTQIFRMIFVAICCLFSHIRLGRIIMLAERAKNTYAETGVFITCRLGAVIT